MAIQTSLSPYSPYLIDVVGHGRLVLTTEGRVLAKVRYPKTPDYYSKSLPDGTPYHEIVAFGTFITIFRNCQYWGARGRAASSVHQAPSDEVCRAISRWPRR